MWEFVGGPIDGMRRFYSNYDACVREDRRNGMASPPRGIHPIGLPTPREDPPAGFQWRGSSGYQQRASGYQNSTNFLGSSGEPQQAGEAVHMVLH